MNAHQRRLHRRKFSRFWSAMDAYDNQLEQLGQRVAKRLSMRLQEHPEEGEFTAAVNILVQERTQV